MGVPPFIETPIYSCVLAMSQNHGARLWAPTWLVEETKARRVPRFSVFCQRRHCEISLAEVWGWRNLVFRVTRTGFIKHSWQGNPRTEWRFLGDFIFFWSIFHCHLWLPEDMSKSLMALWMSIVLEDACFPMNMPAFLFHVIYRHSRDTRTCM